ncbi:cuticular protein 65Ay [Haematobia irritans]|uniref:cuticular protein 65Ay n=1 Tax=Haematobia irritans TaxID=7368 RepID=UPI003F5001AA
MKSLILICIVAGATIYTSLQMAYGAAITNEKGETQLHFDFHQDNGYQRVEDIKFNQTSTVSSSSSENGKDTHPEKPVEFRGGYSFISADGYEYTVKYKANKNGFQPYVTAHKLKDIPK